MISQSIKNNGDILTWKEKSIFKRFPFNFPSSFTRAPSKQGKFQFIIPHSSQGQTIKRQSNLGKRSFRACH